MNKTAMRIGLGLVAAACLGAGALAQDRHDRSERQDRPERPERPQRERGPERGPAAHFDDRYHHDHYYPERGAVIGVLPGGAVSIGFRDRNFFFRGGVWYQPMGGRFVVVAPPFGILVPLLPPAYATLWIGGAPYYYANGVYYAPAPGGYTVVAPPPGADSAQPLPPPPPPTAAAPAPIVYPRNGQTPAQTEADQQQCNSWAATQPSAVADASVFQRAVAACLDARGYTVR